MKRIKKVLSIMLTMTLLFTLVSYGSSGENSSTSSGDPVEEAPAQSGVSLTYVVSRVNTQPTFSTDPAVDYQGNKSLAMGTTELLFTLDDATKEVRPYLAESIEMTDDTTWVVTLRDGIFLTSGKALDAQIVKDSFAYILENNTRLAQLSKISDMHADGLTLTLTTSEPVAVLPRILTEPNFIVFDTEDDNYADGLVGTGPYILQKMDSDGNCDLVRNENYWQGVPAADEVHTLANIEADALTNALQSGEIDFGSVSDMDLQLFDGDPNYTVSTRNMARVYYLYVNENYGFTMDDALREAIQYAINRDAIVAGIYSGVGEPTQSIFPEWAPYYTADALQPAYDAAKAASLLSDAGYVDSDNDGFLEKDGEKVVLKILFYDKNNFKAMAEAVQSLLKDIGIDSEIEVSDTIFDDLTAGAFNIGTYGYNTMTLGDSYNYMQPVFFSEGTSNFCKFNSPEVDALIREMETTEDSGKRAELTQQMQPYIYASNDYIFIMHTLTNCVAKAEMKDLPVGVGGDQIDYMQLWKISKG